MGLTSNSLLNTRKKFRALTKVLALTLAINVILGISPLLTQSASAATLKDDSTPIQLKVLSVSATEAKMTFSKQPENTSVSSGQSCQFSVTVSGGTAPLTYEWFVKDASGTTNNILGANTNTLTLTSTTSTLSGCAYYCVVTDSDLETEKSTEAILTVNAPLSISAQPQNLTKSTGQAAEFSITTAGGTTPITYQWYVSTDNGVKFSAISGATSSKYSISSTQASQNNSKYKCTVKDASNATITSSAVTLSVGQGITITTHPLSKTTTEDTLVTFTAAASGGSAPLTYQWMQKTPSGTATAFANATSNTLTIPAEYSLNGNGIFCAITDKNGLVVNTNEAKLTVNQTPTLNITPETKTVLTGGYAQFSANVVGGTAPHKYTWQISNNFGATFEDIASAKSSTYTLRTSSSTSSTTYLRCLIEDSTGVRATSQSATLYVDLPPWTATNTSSSTSTTTNTGTTNNSTTDNNPFFSSNGLLASSNAANSAPTENQSSKVSLTEVKENPTVVKENPSERTSTPLKLNGKSINIIVTKEDGVKVYTKSSIKSKALLNLRGDVPLLSVGGAVKVNGRSEFWRKVLINDAIGYVLESELKETSTGSGKYLLATLNDNCKLGLTNKSAFIYDNEGKKLGIASNKTAVAIVKESDKYYSILYGKTVGLVLKSSITNIELSDYE